MHDKAGRLKTKLKKVRKELEEAEAKRGELQYKLEVIEKKLNAQIDQLTQVNESQRKVIRKQLDNLIRDNELARETQKNFFNLTHNQDGSKKQSQMDVSIHTTDDIKSTSPNVKKVKVKKRERKENLEQIIKRQQLLKEQQEKETRDKELEALLGEYKEIESKEIVVEEVAYVSKNSWQKQKLRTYDKENQTDEIKPSGIEVQTSVVFNDLMKNKWIQVNPIPVFTYEVHVQTDTYFESLLKKQFFDSREIQTDPIDSTGVETSKLTLRVEPHIRSETQLSLHKVLDHSHPKDQNSKNSSLLLDKTRPEPKIIVQNLT